jgi:hypothetical protein
MRNLMQGTSGNRRSMVLIVAILALVTLFPLVSGLESVDLKPAERFMVEDENTGSQTGVQLSVIVSDMDPVAQSFVSFFVIALLVVLFAIFLRKSSKRALVNLSVLGAELLIIYILLAFFYKPPEGGTLTGPPAASSISVGSGNEAPPVEFLAPEVPQWFVFLVIFAVLSAAGAAGWAAWHFLRPQEATLNQDLARIARRTLKNLEKGGEWGDAVIRCYAEMSEAFDHHRGITRSQSMTPTEFIVHIERYSMPIEPVRTLTRLFEQARYGGRTSGPKETSEAMNCLNQIITFCKVKP